MNLYKITFQICIISILFLFQPIFLFATKASSSVKAGEQKKAEKGLRDNKYFIYYINASITNTGSDEQKTKFSTAIQYDIVAQFYYLRFSFKESYGEIRTAQNLLIELYRENLTEEIVRTRRFLHTHAPKVIHSEDPQARLYISLSYRLLKNAETNMIMADNYKRTLYSLRLYKYIKAMKKLKEAKRYAVTTVLQVSLADRDQLRREYQSYDDIKDLIDVNISDEIKSQMLEYHQDSYYRVDNELTIHEKVWEESNIYDFEPFQKYLEKTD
jgi:sulfur relay (sulfurtransferase) DsrF/TusC family protein